MRLNEFNLARSIILFAPLLFVACDIDRGDIDRNDITTTIVRPIKETAIAGEDTLWMITHSGRLIRLSGGGSEQTEIPIPAEPEMIFFLNESEGWVYAEDGQVWMTRDGGATWSRRGMNPELAPGATDLVFMDAQHGWLILWYGIYATDDGGATWTRTFPTDELKSVGSQPMCISAVGEVAWVGMSNSMVLLTTDRGRNWKVIKIPRADGANAPSGTVFGTSDINSIYADNGREAWAGPGGGSPEGLYYTNDGGDSWSQLLTDPVRLNFGQTSMSFPSGGRGWLFGIEFVRDPQSADPVKGVAFRTDNGKTWNRLSGGVFDIPFERVVFSDPMRGWLIGNDHQSNRSYVHRTNDGGTSWRLVYEVTGPKNR